jgi:hypothetical protein
VAHACNPRYSGGGDQEDRGLKQPGPIHCETLSQKYSTKKWLAEWLKVTVLSSSPSTERKKKKTENFKDLK